MDTSTIVNPSQMTPMNKFGIKLQSIKPAARRPFDEVLIMVQDVMTKICRDKSIMECSSIVVFAPYLMPLSSKEGLCG